MKFFKAQADVLQRREDVVHLVDAVARVIADFLRVFYLTGDPFMIGADRLDLRQIIRGADQLFAYGRMSEEAIGHDLQEIGLHIIDELLLTGEHLVVNRRILIAVMIVERYEMMPETNRRGADSLIV